MGDLVRNAREFAKERHSGQVRKYTGEPYFNHLAEVASIVRDYHNDEYMEAAAYLHDVVEDTETTIGAVESRFGDIVAGYVNGLTDVSKPNDGNRKIRKAMDREHIWAQDDKTQIIKCADLISNTSSITQYDPDFAKVYLEEKRLLLEGMRESVNKHPIWKRAFDLIERPE